MRVAVIVVSMLMPHRLHDHDKSGQTEHRSAGMRTA
jgi:hypothetical protein